MKKILLIILFVLFCAPAWAANLTWAEVPDTIDYTIAGYVVYFWNSEVPDNRYSYLTDVPPLQNIEKTLNLIPGTTYQIAVAPYTTFNELGEESAPIEFVCEERQPLETNLPTHLYIPGPINITIETQ